VTIIRHLVWSLPLLWVGATRQTLPWMVGGALVLAVFPMIFPRIALGRSLGNMYFSSALVLFTLTAIAGVWVSYDAVIALPMLWSILGALSLFVVFANATLSTTNLTAIIAIAGGVLAFYFISQYSHLNYQNEVGFSHQWDV